MEGYGPRKQDEFYNFLIFPDSKCRSFQQDTRLYIYFDEIEIDTSYKYLRFFFFFLRKKCVRHL